MNLSVRVADQTDLKYAASIIREINYWASYRTTGVTSRTEAYIRSKMEEGNALIVLNDKKEWVGFSYLEVWQHEKYVANSGLIIHPSYRNIGISKMLKKEAMKLTDKKYPDAKMFSLTTNLTVVKVNYELGYEKVNVSELVNDSWFMSGCAQTVNFPEMVAKHKDDPECFIMVLSVKKREQNISLKKVS